MSTLETTEAKPQGRLTKQLRSFKTATWLGWQIESNWADPLLFAVYSILKPLATAGILVIMYSVITGEILNRRCSLISTSETLFISMSGRS